MNYEALVKDVFEKTGFNSADHSNREFYLAKLLQVKYCRKTHAKLLRLYVQRLKKFRLLMLLQDDINRARSSIDELQEQIFKLVG